MSRSTRDIDFSIVSPMTQRIDSYADLIVRVGANVQPGQTVYIQALVEHAPLVRAIGRASYDAGARLVDVRYVDNHLRRSFIEHAAEDRPDRIDTVADGAHRSSRRRRRA